MSKRKSRNTGIDDLPWVKRAKNFEVIDKPFRSTYIFKEAFGIKHTDTKIRHQRFKKRLRDNRTATIASYVNTLIYMGLKLQESYEALTSKKELVNIKEIKKFAYLAPHNGVVKPKTLMNAERVTDNTFLDWEMVLSDLLMALNIHLKEVFAANIVRQAEELTSLSSSIQEPDEIDDDDF